MGRTEFPNAQSTRMLDSDSRLNDVHVPVLLESPHSLPAVVHRRERNRLKEPTLRAISNAFPNYEVAEHRCQGRSERLLLDGAFPGRQLLNFSTYVAERAFQRKSKGGQVPVITAVCLCDSQHRNDRRETCKLSRCAKLPGINSPAGSQNLRSDAVCSSFSETAAAQEICFLAVSLWRRVTERAMDNGSHHGSD